MSEMRLEKRTIMAKRLAIKEAVEFSDTVNVFKDKIHKVAKDSGIDEDFLMDWTLDQLEISHVAGRIDDNEEVDD